MCFLEDDQRSKCYSHQIISRLLPIKVTYHCCVDLDHLAQVVFVSVLHSEATLFLPSILYLLEEVSLCSPFLRGDTETKPDPAGPSQVQKPLCVPRFLFVGKGFSLLGLP